MLKYLPVNVFGYSTGEPDIRGETIARFSCAVEELLKPHKMDLRFYDLLEEGIIHSM